MTDPRPVPGPVVPSPALSPVLAEALLRLDDLAGRPVDEHPDVYDDVHRLLQAELAGLEGI